MALAERLEELSYIKPEEEEKLPPFFKDVLGVKKALLKGLRFGENVLRSQIDYPLEYFLGIPRRNLWGTSTTGVTPQTPQTPQTLQTALAQQFQPSQPSQPSLPDIKEEELDAMNAADKGYESGTPDFNTLLQKSREEFTSTGKNVKPLSFWNVGDKFYGGTKMPSGAELKELRKDVKKPTEEEEEANLASITGRRLDNDIFLAQKEAEEAMKKASQYRNTAVGEEYIADALVAIRKLKGLQAEKLQGKAFTQAEKIAEIGVKKTELAQKQKEKELSTRIVSAYQQEQTRMLDLLKDAEKALTDVPSRILDPKMASERTKEIKSVIANIQQKMDENEQRMIDVMLSLGLTPPKATVKPPPPETESYKDYMTPKGGAK